MSELGKKLARKVNIVPFETDDWAGEKVYVRPLPAALFQTLSDGAMLDHLDDIVLKGVCDKNGSPVFDEDEVDDLLQYGSIKAVMDAVSAIMDVSGGEDPEVTEKNSETTPSAARLSA